MPGFVTPEREIGGVLDNVIGKARQRVIVASFASHVHRIQQVVDVAHRYNRRVAFVGRSMVRNMQIAQDLGYLSVPDGLVVDIDTAANLPDDRLVLISTGSQGEPLSALSRMARGEHRQINIRANDLVVLASSLIPGNENSVFAVVNGLAKRGATVVTQQSAKVHVSGHASAGELLYLYNAVRPTNAMPVHGEWRHLRANAALAKATGVPEERIVLAEDGVVVDMVDGLAEIVGQVPVGHVYVDGLSVATSATPHCRTGWSSVRAGSSPSTSSSTTTRAARSAPPRCPDADSPTTRRPSRTRRSWSRRSCCAWPPKASTTLTASPRRSGVSSADGWPTSTVAGR